MDQQKEKFADRLAEIYSDIEPSLRATAHRFKAPNPEVTVREWMSRAYEIVDRFDKGDLKAKVRKDPETQGDLENYDPEVHDEERFIAALKHYLKQCFAYDILKSYNKRKRHREAETQNQEPFLAQTTSEYSQLGFAESSVGLLRYDAIKIASIVKIVKQDWERAKSNSNCLLEAVQERFLFAFLQFCEQLMSRGPEWANLVVVTDIDEKDNKKFFTYDFRSELEQGIRKELCKLIIDEDNPFLVKKLGVIANPNKQSLQKRISRYLYEYRKGYPERLRARIKNKQL